MSQTKPHPWRHPPPKPVPWRVYLAGFATWGKPEPARITCQTEAPRTGAKIRGEGGVIAVWYISLTGWKKPAQFRMKVVSDVLLLSYLHKFDLRVTVEAGQALACLNSEARLYKGPGQANLSQSAATRSTGNIRVDTESRPQQHTWNSEFFVLFPLGNNCCT